jgi:hypothetical protein
MSQITRINATNTSGEIYNTPTNYIPNIFNWSTVSQNINVSLARPTLRVFGSAILNNNFIDPSFENGIFAFNNKRPIAKKTSLSLSGFRNTALFSGASKPSVRSLTHYSKKFGPGFESVGIRNPTFAPNYPIRVYQ